jgi:hypothetical protein
VQGDRVDRCAEEPARWQVARVEHERRASGLVDVDAELAVEGGSIRLMLVWSSVTVTGSHDTDRHDVRVTCHG